MTSITRTQFKEAIAAGISACEAEDAPVPAHVKMMLDIMGRKANVFGTNYNSKPVACPMGTLGFYDQEKGRTTEDYASIFAEGFDNEWSKHVPSLWWKDGGDVVQVTD